MQTESCQVRIIYLNVASLSISAITSPSSDQNQSVFWICNLQQYQYLSPLAALNYTPTIQLLIREFVLLVYLVEECTTTQSSCSSSFHQHLRYNVRNHEAPFILNLSWFEKSLPIVCGPLLSCCLSICLSRNLPFRYLDSSSQLRLCWARGSLPSQIRQLVGQD